MKRPDLTIEAARYKLGLLSSDDLVRTADALLTCGVYLPVTDELASIDNPVATEADALFERLLAESGVPLPSVDEAVSGLLSAYISQIALATVEPRPGLDSVIEVYLAAEVPAVAGGRAGASLGIDATTRKTNLWRGQRGSGLRCRLTLRR
jgi:hypothetical protein